MIPTKFLSALWSRAGASGIVNIWKKIKAVDVEIQYEHHALTCGSTTCSFPGL